MKLAPPQEPKRFPTGVKGLVRILLASLLFWWGVNSFLVGLAYSHASGAWAAIASGLAAGLISAVVMWKGAGQVVYGLSAGDDRDDDYY
jgi:hypothetical protein